MNLSDYPIDHGRYLIEASAGTGKTYTITHLILRLILQGVPVRKILVTTFSNAAADELKARILALLNEERNKLIPDPEQTAEPETAETYHPDLFHSSDDLKSRILLQLAISSIDEMTVSTIHGFCQKMLGNSPSNRERRSRPSWFRTKPRTGTAWSGHSAGNGSMKTAHRTPECSGLFPMRRNSPRNRSTWIPSKARSWMKCKRSAGTSTDLSGTDFRPKWRKTARCRSTT